MANILNIDHWDWVHPETQKVTRLRRGDEVPAEILGFTEDGGDSMFEGPRPVLIKGKAETTPQDPSGTSPKQAIDKK